MDPERGWDEDYEGFASAEKRDAARRQRAIMFRWRLSCSGQDPELVSRYGRGEGLSFDEAQRLDDELRINNDVLTWRELHERCGHSLSHFVAFGKHLRTPSIETLIDMAEVGGADVIAAMLRERESLTTKEVRQLSMSPVLSAKLRNLAPELLPVHEPVSTTSTDSATANAQEETKIEDNVVQLPLSQPEITPPKRASGYFSWEHFVAQGGPIGFEVDTFPSRCVDSLDGTWKDDCAHEQSALDYSSPAYLNLLTGHLPVVDGGEALIQDLHLAPDYAGAVRECLQWWYEYDRRWGAAAAHLQFKSVSSRVLNNLFPDHYKGDKIQAGYRLLRSLFFRSTCRMAGGPSSGDRSAGQFCISIMDLRLRRQALPSKCILRALTHPRFTFTFGHRFRLEKFYGGE